MFEPINKAHAISEVVVYFQFTPNLVPALPSLKNLKTTLKDRFPRQDDAFTFAVELKGQQGQLSATPTEVSAASSGFTLSRFGTDGDRDWLLRVEGSSISIHCFEYSRWDDVWGEMRDVIKHVLKSIGRVQVDISAVGLKYVDRFIWQGAVEDCDAGILLSRESPFLHGKAFDSSNRWHCHIGWFNNQTAESEELNQLNIDSGLGLIEGRKSIIVTIDHAQTLRRIGSRSIDHLIDDASEDSPLNELMESLHKQNKNTLVSLLQESMATRISLETSTS